MFRTINILIKVTDACNLRCKYCFHSDSGYASNSIVSLSKISKIIDLASSEYDRISIVFHGGEPLLAPDDFFKQVVSYASKCDALFRFSLQTNATLLTPEKLRYLQDLGIHVGISFDGLENEHVRGGTSSVLKNISDIYNADMHVGALCVISSMKRHFLIDQYRFFNDLGLSVKFNPMFIAGAAADNKLANFNYQEFARQYIDLFKYWANDANANIGVDNFYEIIDAVLFNTARNCLYTSCLGKWLCMDHFGDIYPCDRLSGNREYWLGNVMKIKSIEELLCSDNFIALLINAIERKQYCIENCEIYKWCNAACNSEAILAKDASLPNFDACSFRRNVLLTLEPFVRELYQNYLNNSTVIKNIPLRSFFASRISSF